MSIRHLHVLALVQVVRQARGHKGGGGCRRRSGALCQLAVAQCARTSTTLDLRAEDEARARLSRLKLDCHVSKLTAATRLLLVLVTDLIGPRD